MRKKIINTIWIATFICIFTFSIIQANKEKMANDINLNRISSVQTSSNQVSSNATLSNTMTDAAILLQQYCTNNELYPLASEWWHFNDLNSLESIGKIYGKGTFTLTQHVSSIPSE